MTSLNKQPKTDAELAESHFQHPQPQSQGNPASDQVFTVNGTQQQLQDLTNKVTAIENKKDKVVFNTGIIGLFETVTSLPTTGTTANNPKGIPLSPYDQVKIFNGKLYFYDSVNKVWDIAGGSAVFSGQVNSSGSIVYGPSGWTSSGTSSCTITHNLGTTSYAVVVSLGPVSSTGFLVVNSLGANSFTVNQFNTGSSPAATNWSFVLSMN